MNNFSIAGTNPLTIIPRSMGIKLLVVCGLALVMTIPSFFVEGILADRTRSEADVVRDIGTHVGGQQTVLGPVLAVPYTIAARTAQETEQHGTYFVFPAHADATIKTTTEERHRSLFKVPVFQANMRLDASFDLSGVPTAAPERATLDWSHAELVVGVSDARGALADGELFAGGKSSTLAPAQIASSLSLGENQGKQMRLTLFGSNAGAIAKPDAQFSATANLRFSGAQRIAMLAYGKTTHVAMQGDWPSPSFDGGFLPITRSVTEHGFSAEWSVPYIARGVRAEGLADTFTGLDATALGVSFVEMADPYQSISRSLKYAPLFLGLIFLSYFIFEVTAGKRVHPAQYVLVGMAQIIFYLLLLSLGERIGFDFGFLVAGAASVILLAANAGWIFSSKLQGVRALGVFSLLYALIYLLLRLEDDALLVGAIASFAAVATTMYFTRRIDWYSSQPLNDPGDAAGQNAA
jgi:inner membrane protein